MKMLTRSTRLIAVAETGNDAAGRSSVIHNFPDDGRASSAMKRVDEEDISFMTPLESN